MMAGNWAFIKNVKKQQVETFHADATTDLMVGSRPEFPAYGNWDV
jgi:hypothetical protein